LWAAFFHGFSYALILAQKWLGYILGDFFKNSSGHPARLSNLSVCRMATFVESSFVKLA
jgi:hypothetical protein